MNLTDIQFFFEYNYWANRLILDTAAALTPKQLTQPNNFSFGSLQGTLIHILDSEHLWRQVIRDQRVPEKRLIELQKFPTLDAIISYWEQEEREMWAYLSSLNNVEQIIHYQVEEGLRERVLWQCLVHMVNHGTQHRSECAVMLTDFGHSPGGIDMTRYLNEKMGYE